MEINIRKSIIHNFKNTSIKEIETSIEDSLKEKEDLTLPGMGVFFEILWENSPKKLKTEILEIINKNL